MTRQPTLVGCMLVRERHDTAASTCWLHAVGIAMLLRVWRSSGEAGQGEA